MGGGVHIGKEAPGSDTHLLAKSLLLSGQASARIVPQLFVHNDSVSAGHGSVIAPMDGEELFYLQSRGVGEQEAKKLVLQGFLGEHLKKSGIGKQALASIGNELEKGAMGVFPRD
jgi:Fe-S cluster assembly protein SufD